MLLLSTLYLAVAMLCNHASANVEHIKKLAVANNDFAFKLHRTFNAQGNAFYSPTSIFVALGMLYQGARGVTADEIKGTLSYDIGGLNDENVNSIFQELLSFIEKSPNQYQLDIANAIVSQLQYPILGEYKEILQTYYSAVADEVDFENESNKALQAINSWVSRKTNGKIPRLLETLSPATVLVLLNAVYFKGTWKKQFLPRRTRNEIFYNDGVNEASVPMMNAKDVVLYGEERNFKALKLQYNGGDISMVLLLPHTKDGLSEVEKELNASKLDDIISGMENVEVAISIPKFNLEDSRELTDTLVKLGMNSSFGNGANFNGISEARLKVSTVVHKAVVEVNEEGSEAAAGTSIGIVPVSIPLPPRFSFHADHPFLFFIRDDRTGMILFSGRLSNV